MNPLENKQIKHESTGDALEIATLKTRLAQLEYRQTPEKTELSKETVIRQEIKDYIKEAQEISPVNSPRTTRDEAKEIAQFEPSQQLGALIDIALQKGMSHAVSVAKDLNNPAILDELHDTLVDQYYDKLLLNKMLD